MKYVGLIINGTGLFSYPRISATDSSSYTFSNVFTMASPVSRFSLLISVIVSCIDLLSWSCASCETTSVSSAGVIFSTKNFLSSWEFFLTLSLRVLISATSLERSWWKASCKSTVYLHKISISVHLLRPCRDEIWRCRIARQTFYSVFRSCGHKYVSYNNKPVDWIWE